MKIGILTFHFADNYGAVLQTYALQSYLQQMGHEVHVIDYRPDYMTHGGRLRLPMSKRDLKIDAQIMFVRWANLRGRWGGSRLTQSFADFRRARFQLSQKQASSLGDLRALDFDYDAYICGSDQIWNPPLRTGVDPAYYAAFAKAGCRRIAYAASFGRSDIEPEYHSEIGRLLGGMDSISIREESGVVLTERLSQKKAFWAPDPTLLLDEYEGLCVSPGREPYVFTYVLRGDDLVGGIQKQVAMQLGLPSYVPYVPQQRWRISAQQVCLSPAEWLGNIREANFVVTNSFHGTIFCILFRKPFIAVSLKGQKQSLSDRLISLLKRLQLQERFVTEHREDQIRELMQREIDWGKPIKLLQTWRTETRSFLQQALV